MTRKWRTQITLHRSKVHEGERSVNHGTNDVVRSSKRILLSSDLFGPVKLRPTRREKSLAIFHLRIANVQIPHPVKALAHAASAKNGSKHSVAAFHSFGQVLLMHSPMDPPNAFTPSTHDR